MLLSLAGESLTDRKNLHKKDDFAEVSKNFAKYNLKIILLDLQNNYVGRLNCNSC